MSPLDLHIIERKKKFLNQELKLLKKLHTEELNDSSEIVLQHALCHSIQNSITAVIDIAQHIVAEEGKPPTSYYDSIKQLGELNYLPNDFVVEFSKIAKLRNVVVHLYEDLSIAHLVSLLPKLIEGLEKFLVEIQKSLESK